MSKYLVRIFLPVAFFGFLSMFSMAGMAAAAMEETIMGAVVKSDKGLVIEADDGDYIVRGKDLSKLVGKLVEVNGIITESHKGDTIQVKSVKRLEETQPE